MPSGAAVDTAVATITVSKSHGSSSIVLTPSAAAAAASEMASNQMLQLFLSTLSNGEIRRQSRKVAFSSLSTAVAVATAPR